MDAQLSIGFELEVKLAFEAPELLSANPHLSNLELIKTHDEPVISRRAAAVQKYANKAYRSWGLRDPSVGTAYPESLQLQKFKQEPVKLCDYRQYSNEPLRLVQDRLAKNEIKSTIHDDLTCKVLDFTPAPWSIQRDGSLSGLTNAKKLTAFSTTITNLHEAKDVDVYGVEFVSWPFTSSATANETVSAAAAALKAGLKHKLIADAETGLHAHVGTTTNSPFPLRVLQNLFLIAVLFEDQLSTIHSPSRRRGANNPELVSNRVEFYAEGSPEVMHSVSPDSAPVLCFQNFTSVSEIVRKIFEEVDQATNPQHRFQALVGVGDMLDFGYCFRNASRGEGAATVEFRQHDGCALDGEEVGHWFEHCGALVRLAQRYAQMDTDVCQQFGVSDWEGVEKVEIEMLWREMGLAEETRKFYTERIARFERETPGWKPFPLVFEACPELEPEETEEFEQPAEADEPAEHDEPAGVAESIEAIEPAKADEQFVSSSDAAASLVDIFEQLCISPDVTTSLSDRFERLCI